MEEAAAYGDVNENKLHCDPFFLNFILFIILIMGQFQEHFISDFLLIFWAYSAESWYRDSIKVSSSFVHK